MTCVHCNGELDLTQRNVLYPRSEAVAHVRCVSFPSAARMDDYLVKWLKRSSRS